MGCILAELWTGGVLFSTHDEVEHLALMERTPARSTRPPSAVPELGACASSGRAWRPWLARHSRYSQGDRPSPEPIGAGPVPRVLEPAASKAADAADDAADVTAVYPPGTLGSLPPELVRRPSSSSSSSSTTTTISSSSSAYLLSPGAARLGPQDGEELPARHPALARPRLRPHLGGARLTTHYLRLITFALLLTSSGSSSSSSSSRVGPRRRTPCY